MVDTVAKGYIKLEDNIAEEMKKISSGLDAINSRLESFASNSIKSFLGAELAVKGLELAGHALYEVFSETIKIRMETDQAKNGIAAIISSMYEVKDASGKIVEGPQAFKQALLIAQDEMNKLRLDSIKTGLVFHELVETYQNGLSAGAAAGMTKNQIHELTVLGMAAGKALNIGGQQFATDFKDLLLNVKNTDLQKKLGLMTHTPLREAYAESIKLGKQYEFLRNLLQQYGEAGKASADNLSGAFNAVKDVINALGMEMSSGLNDSLKGVRETVEKVFNFDTGEITPKLDGFISAFNAVGSVIGKEINGALEDTINFVEDIGTYLETDQSPLNGMFQSWEMIKETVGNIFGLIGDIVGQIISVSSIIMNSMNSGLDGTNEKLTTAQSVSKIITGFFAEMNVNVAFLRDLVGLVGDGLRISVGSAFSYLDGLVAKLYEKLAVLMRALHATDTAMEMDKQAISLKQGEQMWKDIATKNNKTVEAIKSSASIGDLVGKLFGNTAKAMDDGANAINKAGSKDNDAFKQYKEELEKQRKEAEERRKNANADLKSKMPSGSHDKGKDGNPEKVGYDDEIKALDKLISNADKAYKRFTEINKEHLKAMDISTKQYYDDELKALEENHNFHMQKLDEEYKKTEEYLSKTKNAGERKKITDKLESIKSRKTDDTQNYEDQKSKLQIESRKALADVQKKNNELEAEYLALIGKTEESTLKKISDKYTELQKSKDITLELSNELLVMERMEVIQDKLNQSKKAYEAVVQSVSSQEKSVELMKNAGQIGELSYLLKIKEIRSQNADAEIKAIQEEIALEEQHLQLLEQQGASQTAITESKTKINDFKNQIKEIQNNIDPLAQKIDESLNNGLGTFMDDMVNRTKSVKDAFRDLATSIEKDITSLVSKNLSTQLMQSLFGSSSSGGGSGFGSFFSSLFSSGSGGSFLSGMFADGGNVLPSDKPILVGERGPEIWQPSGSGKILNNGDSSKVGGGNQSLVINVHGVTDANSFRASEGQIGAEIMSKLNRTNKRNN